MKFVLSTFFNICLLRRSPEYVPTHTGFVGIVIGADMLLQLVLFLRLNEQATTPGAITYIVVTSAAMAALTWFLLFLRRLDARFPATVAALFGCDFLLMVLLSVLLLFTGTAETPLTMSVLAFVAIWSIAVSGYILHQALQVTVFVGILLAIGTSLISLGIGDAASGIPRG